ncbi:MAG: DegT/DnrJ/EryC1/StrS family aminotransferase [Opitutaceae bacterium]|nr:DegT/DnrJ/EryC1/StrS family aminotransferase [Cytophagales bacterium]
MVDLVSQHEACKIELDTAIQKVLAHGAFINGPEVKTFGQNLSDYLNVKQLVPCANGTDALQIALMALDLKPGDEVITTSFNYVAGAEAVALLGMIPVFAEVNTQSFNLDISSLEKHITSKTKAIIVVHLFGQACDMDEIMALADKHHLYVIEDNAQSLGTEVNYKGKWQKAGTIGHIGTTSFFPTKNLGCMGDGGAVFSNDEALMNKCKSISSHGQGQRYEFQRIGINSRLDTIQAAILDVKLKSLKDSLEKRKKGADKYFELLSGIKNIELPFTQSFSNHTYNQFVIKVLHNQRDSLKQYLSDHQIPSMIYYPKPLHLQPAYAYLNGKMGDFLVSEQLCEQVLALPIHPELSGEQILYITDRIKDFFHAR